MIEPPRPPAHVEPYVRILGQDMAVRFLLAFGGAELYIAANPKGRAMVSELLSDDQVSALAALDLPKRVPTAKPWIAHVLKSQGLSHAEIARRLHTTDVTVRRHLANYAGPRIPDPRQPSLF